MPRPKAEFRPAKLAGARFERATFCGPSKDLDPLAGVKETGDPEVDLREELNAMQRAFKDRAQAEERRRKKALDAEHWLCLCFQTRAQVNDFLRVSGWGPENTKYLDGQSVARKIGVKIAEDRTGFGRPRIDGKWADLSMDMDVSD